MKVQNVSNQIATLGQKLQEPMVIKVIDFGEAANSPFFDFVPDSDKIRPGMKKED